MGVAGQKMRPVGISRKIFDELAADALPGDLQKTLSRRIDVLLRELVLAREQLKQVGGDPSKLGIQYQAKERQNIAEMLALFPADAIADAREAGASEQMSLHDPVTLMKGKAYLGRLIRRLSKEDARDYRFMVASADLDNFGSSTTVGPMPMVTRPLSRHAA